jgi:prephenate dehydratase
MRLYLQADVTAETSRHDTAAGEQARAFKEAGSVENQKTSLIFSISDEPGSLATALKTLEEHGVSMSHIESRPSKGT